MNFFSHITAKDVAHNSVENTPNSMRKDPVTAKQLKDSIKYGKGTPAKIVEADPYLKGVYFYTVLPQSQWWEGSHLALQYIYNNCGRAHSRQ